MSSSASFVESVSRRAKILKFSEVCSTRVFEKNCALIGEVINIQNSLGEYVTVMKIKEGVTGDNGSVFTAVLLGQVAKEVKVKSLSEKDVVALFNCSLSFEGDIVEIVIDSRIGGEICFHKVAIPDSNRNVDSFADYIAFFQYEDNSDKRRKIQKIKEWVNSATILGPSKPLMLKDLCFPANYRFDLICKVLRVRILSDSFGILTVTDGTVCSKPVLTFSDNLEAKFRMVKTDKFGVDIIVVMCTKQLEKVKKVSCVQLFDIQVKSFPIPQRKMKNCFVFKLDGHSMKFEKFDGEICALLSPAVQSSESSSESDVLTDTDFSDTENDFSGNEYLSQEGGERNIPDADIESNSDPTQMEALQSEDLSVSVNKKQNDEIHKTNKISAGHVEPPLRKSDYSLADYIKLSQNHVGLNRGDQQHLTEIKEWFETAVILGASKDIKLKELCIPRRQRVNLVGKILQIRNVSERFGIITVCDGTLCPEPILKFNENLLAEFVLMSKEDCGVDIAVVLSTSKLHELELDGRYLKFNPVPKDRKERSTGLSQQTTSREINSKDDSTDGILSSAHNMSSYSHRRKSNVQIEDSSSNDSFEQLDKEPSKRTSSHAHRSYVFNQMQETTENTTDSDERGNHLVANHIVVHNHREDINEENIHHHSDNISEQLEEEQNSVNHAQNKQRCVNLPPEKNIRNITNRRIEQPSDNINIFRQNRNEPCRGCVKNVDSVNICQGNKISRTLGNQIKNSTVSSDESVSVQKCDILLNSVADHRNSDIFKERLAREFETGQNTESLTSVRKDGLYSRSCRQKNSSVQASASNVTVSGQCTLRHTAVQGKKRETRARKNWPQVTLPDALKMSNLPAGNEFIRSSRLASVRMLKQLSALYRIRAWVKDLFPPVSGGPLDLISGVCRKCFLRCVYTNIKYLNVLSEKQLCSSCSKTDHPVYMDLVFYFEVLLSNGGGDEIVVLVCGSQAERALGCSVINYLKDPIIRQQIWDYLQNLVFRGRHHNYRRQKDMVELDVALHIKDEQVKFKLVNGEIFIENHK